MIINRFIIHILDKNSDMPILNDFESRLTQDVDKFIQTTVKKISKDDSLRKAVFKEYNENIVKECCEQILYNEDTFLENSKEIAAYLFDVMKTSEGMTSGNLGICLYTIKDEKYVAIIKFDYKKSYTHYIEFIDDKFNIQMRANESGISESQKPKQCAIVGFSSINDEYHLRILDKIYEKEDNNDFIKAFLNTDLILDSKYQTKSFKNLSETFITNSLSGDIKKAEDSRSLLNYKLKTSSDIDVNEIAMDIMPNKELAESFIEYIDEKEIEANFEIDKEWIEKNLKKRSIKTDTGFQVKGNLEDFEDPMKYSVKQNEDGSINIILKNVKFYEN